VAYLKHSFFKIVLMKTRIRSFGMYAIMAIDVAVTGTLVTWQKGADSILGRQVGWF
jgi:hypothetical protein